MALKKLIMRIYVKAIIASILWVMGTLGAASAEPADSAQSEAKSPYRVSLITIYPGSEVFELFGHTDLRLVTSDGIDMIFNYGVFDFNSENFFLRFVSGETDYMCEAYPTHYLKAGYEGRRMVEQELNLTDAQVKQMWNFLVMNAQPMYRNYRYKYFSDNCSTRPLNVVEEYLGGELKFADDGERVTYRDIIHRYTKNYAWEQLGIDLLIGRDADTIINRRQKMFVPMLLMEALREETVARDGRMEKLVTSEQVINAGSEQGLVKGPTPTPLHPMAVLGVLLVAMVWLTVVDIGRGKVNRVADTVLWAVALIVGIVVWYVTFVSTHESTSPNFNAVWLHPFYVIPLVLTWVKRSKKWLAAFHALNVAALAVAAVQWPMSGQSPNPAFFIAMGMILTRDINYLIVEKRCRKTV